MYKRNSRVSEMLEKRENPLLLLRLVLLHLLLLLLLALLLGHASKPIKPDRRKDVENNKSPQDTKVAPALVVVAVDLAQEDVGASVRAETARARRSRRLGSTASDTSRTSRRGGARIPRIRCRRM
jgi:hypothetical protein